jgi:hypothetical protein
MSNVPQTGWSSVVPLSRNTSEWTWLSATATARMIRAAVATHATGTAGRRFSWWSMPPSGQRVC